MKNRRDNDNLLQKVDREKRDFLKKVVVGTAFAVPVINSFSMEGLKIDLSGRMAKADEFDKPGGYDGVAVAVAVAGGSGGSGSSGSGSGGGKGGGKGGPAVPGS